MGGSPREGEEMRSVTQLLKLFLDTALSLIFRASWLPGNARGRGEEPSLLELGDDQRIKAKVRVEDIEVIKADFAKGKQAFASKDYKTSITSFEAVQQRLQKSSAVALHNTSMSRFNQAHLTKSIEDYDRAREYASKAESLLDQPGEVYSERARRIVRNFRGKVEANPVIGWKERGVGK